MNSHFEKIIQHSKDTQSIIAIFQDPSGSDFWAGYILDYNDEFFVMQHVTKFGKLDGILIEPLYKIRRIDQDDYCKCLQYILKHNEELDKEQEIELSIPKEENWMYHTLKKLEGETDYIVRICIGSDSRFSGFVKEVSEDDFILKCVGHDGQDEGKLYFTIDDVASFRINDLEARRRLMLYHFRQSVDFYL
jgi:hypothetical protein